MPKSRRKTGATQETRQQVMTRALFRCEKCGDWLQGAMSIHHRRPRGMGGTKRTETNFTSNLMALCGTGTTGCHGWIENNRQEAYEKGWLVSQRDEPTQVPVKSFLYGWIYLDDEGGFVYAR